MNGLLRSLVVRIKMAARACLKGDLVLVEQLERRNETIRNLVEQRASYQEKREDMVQSYQDRLDGVNNRLVAARATVARKVIVINTLNSRIGVLKTKLNYSREKQRSVEADRRSLANQLSKATTERPSSVSR